MTEDQYWKVIGTLGNLTWVPQGRVPDLGVAERKKELLKMTRYGLELVRTSPQIARWSADEIEARSQRLGRARAPDLARARGARCAVPLVVGNWKMNTTLGRGAGAGAARWCPACAS